ncbi:hypothetical protein EDM54_25335 [Brevibacillus borstelensis]|jgi:hypothetical protein|uniref:Uncharacterized protein n=1 Tax=Brevibacillus borstelensis AK1 TaxID=1300222 RepID=M8E098_9BACL|nr:hypothetical protein I532_08052 [Brevibacillus borstelensis AK1]KKX55845.1 hypothetical protein X546_09380 [Brevibacillus borstelensis cifa_chp40]RNB55239.1 hypothetical protein EDM54_25335 [Brevibacillus borstelensis]
MFRHGENIIIIENIWFILVPLLLGIIGLSCLLVGIVRKDKISLLVSTVCFLCLFLFATACHFLIPPITG